MVGKRRNEPTSNVDAVDVKFKLRSRAQLSGTIVLDIERCNCD